MADFEMLAIHLRSGVCRPLLCCDERGLDGAPGCDRSGDDELDEITA
jgi:hypothetical protein